MRVNLFVLCDHAHTHQGLLTAVGIRRRLVVPEMPWVHSQLYLAWEMIFDHSEFLEGQTSPFTLRITLQNEDGKGLLDLRRKTQLRGQVPAGGRASQFEVLGLSNITFRNPGPHTFVMRVNDVVKTDITFDVLQADPPKKRRLESGEGDG